MSTLKAKEDCDALAEKVIGDYVRECGAFGDPNELRKVLELLISKAALGLVVVSDEDFTQKVLLRTCVSAAEYAERRRRTAS